MKCSKARLLLSAMLDGELGRSEEEAVLRHVESCERCRRELEELRRLRDVLGALPSEPLPLHVRMGVLSAIGAEAEFDGLTCEEARQAMHLLLDGEAPEALERAVRVHLAACRECAREFEELRRGVELVRSLPRVEPPARVLSPERYVAGREAPWREVRPPVWSLRAAYAYAVAAAMLAALVAVGVWRMTGTGPAGVAIAGRPEKRVALAPAERMARLPALVRGERRHEVRAVRRVERRASPAPAASKERAEKAAVRPKRARSVPSPRAVEPRPERAPMRTQRRAVAAPAHGSAPPAVVKAVGARKVESGAPARRRAPQREAPVEVAASPGRPPAGSAPAVIKRPAEPQATGEQRPREVQKEEVKGGPEGAAPEGGRESSIEPSPEEGPEVKVALGKGSEGVEILRFEF